MPPDPPKSPAKPKPYESPVPGLGPVLWAPRPSGPWYAALATKIGPAAIGVIVFAENSRGGSPRESVLHASDPRFASIDQKDGVWDFTADQKLLAQLAARTK